MTYFRLQFVSFALAFVAANLSAGTPITGIWGDKTFRIEDSSNGRKIKIKDTLHPGRAIFESKFFDSPLCAFSPGDDSPFLILVAVAATCYTVTVFTDSDSQYLKSVTAASYVFPELIVPENGSAIFMIASYGDGHAAKISTWRSKIFEMDSRLKKLKIIESDYSKRWDMIRQRFPGSGL